MDGKRSKVRPVKGGPIQKAKGSKRTNQGKDGKLKKGSTANSNAKKFNHKKAKTSLMEEAMEYPEDLNEDEENENEKEEENSMESEEQQNQVEDQDENGQGEQGENQEDQEEENEEGNGDGNAEEQVGEEGEAQSTEGKGKEKEKEKIQIEDSKESNVTFESLGLDPRLTRALARNRFLKPTLIQIATVPIALQGKDILCRARTGSGKTAAYTLPILQKILLSKEASESEKKPGVKALILVPTRELCEQVKDHIKEMTYYCQKDITFVHLLSDATLESQKALLIAQPDIVVTTPSRIIAHLEKKNVVLKETLETLVIDEADLVLSFGYDEDLRKLLKHLPRICQTFLMSATLTADIEKLKQLVLRNAAVLKLEEDHTHNVRLTQYCIKCSEEEKFLLLYFILKLQLIKGKSIIFVNDIERCFRVKLFLEQFGIKSCVLNSELPQNSRYHIVQEFNKGIYDYLIATDEGDVEELEEGNVEDDAESSNKKPSKNGKSKKDKEYGMSRGVDFKEAAAVINFDFPKTVRNYTHRIGRTARGNASGLALSLVSPDEIPYYEVVEEDQANAIKPFGFNMKDVDGFRYRVADALRAVTRVRVKEARLREIKAEILNSEKLQAHFEDNPKDLQALRHDRPASTLKVPSHMKHIPGYLMPGHKKGTQSIGIFKGGVKFRNDQKGAPSKVSKKPIQKNKFSKKKRNDDPLKTFQSKKK